MNARFFPAVLLLLATPTIQADEKFSPEMAEFVKRFKGGGALGDNSPRPTPQEALAQLKVADGFAVDVAASEPMVRQPLNVYFDERGRLWVVQYLQYPFPAGLKVVRYDQYLRAVFDRTPPPPPNHIKGADRVTIIEDSNGDGVFDKAKDFLADLNIARSVVTGRGGVWVLNPPYLLFYPDKDRDDVPDGPPEVRLSGFGIEDTHSGANSLAWGPDGWLYGAHGSTCTADVQGVKFLGQAIWRYHPTTRAFEVFAEGGGNTYSLDFDSQGRVFSGTNGSARGLHYPQGAAFVKNWGKHGPLMNPYSFGWFEHMAHKGDTRRFSQSMAIYEGAAMPSLEGRFIAAMALTNRVLPATLARDTSTFRTDDGPPLIESASRWFRPVDTKVGPDGAIYIADWCDSRLSHLDPRDTWDKDSGRIWRLRAAGTLPKSERFDFAAMTGAQLVEKLSHPNKWHRQTALRVLWDRGDSSLAAGLRELVTKERGQLALEAFWAVNACGGFDPAYALQTLTHPNPMVRYWTLRLLGDAKQVTPPVREALVKLAGAEPEVEVRTQLASTARRLPAADAIPILRELLLRGEDAADKLQPLLLWWAIESKCATDRDAILALLAESPLWSAPIFRQTITSRLGQRFTAERSEANLVTSAHLLALAPTREDRLKLVEGMDTGLQGNAVTSVPAELRDRLGSLWSEGEPVPALVRLGVRLGHAPALGVALDRVRDVKALEAERRSFIELLAERREQALVPVLLELLRREKAESMQLALTNALQRFGDENIARAFLELAPESSQKVRAAVFAALCSRPPWARLLLDAVDAGSIKKEQVSPSNLLAIQGLRDAACDAVLNKHWSQLKPSSAEKEARILQVRKLLASAKGSAEAGRDIFKAMCATCHTFLKEGGKIGPDLTGYERDNLDFMLPAIVDPNLAIREEFTAFTAVTRDGQTLTGFIEAQTPQSVTMRDLTGQKLLLGRADLQSLTASPVSLMPEGLLEALGEQQVRDLFAYLMKK
jgi:putative heme-binding domain-containing protein